MTGNTGVLSAALTLVSVASLSLFALMCLRCKKKSKIIHEELQVYNPQTFQREGSRFAVTRSKTVTRPSPIPLESLDDYEEFPQADPQSDYQNVTKDCFPSVKSRRMDYTYVAPLPLTVYENERDEQKPTDSVHTSDIYANTEQARDDEDDYENSQFLKEQEEGEPDYVNEDGT